jgi:nucleolar protein 56
MKAYVGTGAIGCFAFDEEGKLIDFVLFPKDAKAVEERLAMAARGEQAPEEGKLLENVKKRGYVEIEVGRRKADRMIAERLRDLAKETGFLKVGEVNRFLFEVGAAGARKILKQEKKERIIVHIIGLIDDLDKHLNVYSERLREWYGLYFPEVTKRAKSNEQLARIAARGRKDEIKEEEYAGLAKISVGMEFSEEDVKSVSSFATRLLAMFKERKSLGDYLEKLAAGEMPNLTAVAGSVLAARLVAAGGGLEKMAKMPTSRIQLLGAERALFRHMRENTKAPKYGLIFGHDLIQKAPENKKGKAARCVASKLSLASKMDFFSRKNQGSKLREELEEEMKRVLGET